MIKFQHRKVNIDKDTYDFAGKTLTFNYPKNQDAAKTIEQFASLFNQAIQDNYLYVYLLENLNGKYVILNSKEPVEDDSEFQKIRTFTRPELEVN